MLVRWVLSSCGSILWKRTDLPETGLGQDSDVILGMIEKCDLSKGSTRAMDNFFTTLPLLDKLTDMSMYGVVPSKKTGCKERLLRKSCTLKGNQGNIWLHIWWKQFACCLERQQSCHSCHQLFVAKSSFLNKALVESWEKACRHTDA